MKLHEYQSKTIFSKYGIPIPKGRVAATAQEAKQIAEELGGRVVIKAQVLVGGRGKAGGVKLAKDPAEAAQLAAQILGMEIKGLPVRKVLVDEASAIDQEIYFSITNDRAAKKPVMIASAAGGIDIEEVAAKTPDKIIKSHIDPLLGLREYQARDVAVSHGPAARIHERLCKNRHGSMGSLQSHRRNTCRDQPAGHHKRQENGCARRQDDDRRQRTLPSA